jgi:hypothetical protein
MKFAAAPLRFGTLADIAWHVDCSVVRFRRNQHKGPVAMTDPLATYVHDHLAGAEFAVNLLEDLRDQSLEARIAILAEELLEEVQADREVLERFSEMLTTGSGTVKKAAAWVAHKASRVKLDPQDLLGAFESLETICLGISGKLALWNSLKTLDLDDQRVATLDLDDLAARAIDQHARAEKLRLAVAPSALSRSESDEETQEFPFFQEARL